VTEHRREQIRKASAKYKNKLNNQGICHTCRNPKKDLEHVNCLTCRNKFASNMKARRDEQKRAVYEYYSPNGVKCACCGEKELAFLSIDHINGGGKRDCKENGSALSQRLFRQGFPEGFQILCMNCNHGRYRNGGICPHKGESNVKL
jgi:hypothetical protein